MNIFKYISALFEDDPKTEEKYQADVVKCRYVVDRMNMEMTSKFCPTIQGTCSKTCINFKASYVEEYEDIGFTKCVVARFPECKLWR